MLLEFIVENFRSIRGKQTFNMVASPDKEHLEANSSETGLSTIPRALRVGAIYGANAAGKSNLLRALGFMRQLVVGSANTSQEGQGLPHDPFAFDVESKTQPSHFEIHFIDDSTRYEYGFRLTRERVVEEWLNASPEGGRIQKWFHREFNAEKDSYDYDFGSYFLGLKQVWKKSTRSNALFISTAVQLNSEQLKPIFTWFQTKLTVFANSPLVPDPLTANMAAKDDVRPFLVWLMKTADKSIVDFSVEEKTPDKSLAELESIFSHQIADLFLKQQIKEVSVFHTVNGTNEKVGLKLTEESAGTQRFFSIAWPWIQAVMDSSVLLVDELDASLHPLMTKFLVQLFMGTWNNKSKAQLIFTTHDTSLLNGDFLRRDQIWFAEKDANNSSNFYPLTDFSPRKGEALEKGYLQGRYGALPFIGELKF